MKRALLGVCAVVFMVNGVRVQAANKFTFSEQIVGGPQPQCAIPPIAADTVTEVGRRAVEFNNQVTTMNCSQTCRNPVSFVGADEIARTFTMQSICTGSNYTYSAKILPDPKQPIPCESRGETRGNPCNPMNGQKIQREVDYDGPNLRFERLYNSFAGARENTSESMGRKWRHNYDRRIFVAAVQSPRLPYVIVDRPTGQSYTFNLVGSVWVGPSDIADRLTSVTGGYELVTNEDEIERYNLTGQLLQVQARNGDVTTLTYDLSNRMSAVTAPDGRALTFDYPLANTTRMTDPAGKVYTYAFVGGASGDYVLQSVTYPDGVLTSQRAYQYSSTPILPFPLLAQLTDENGMAFASWSYDTQGRVITSQHNGGVERVDFGYNTTNSTVTDVGGASQTYSTSVLQGVDRLMGVTGGQCADCGQLSAAVTYDANGYQNLVTDFNGNITDYDHDARGLEVRRVEAKGTTSARTTVIQWHAALHVPIQSDIYVGEGIAGANLARTTYTYSGGRLATRTDVDPQTTTSRVTTYVYYGDEVGDNPILARLLKRIDGPRSLPAKDVTEYFYAITDSAVHKKRDLIEVKQWRDGSNALSTFIDEHDAHGRPQVMRDANGIKTKLEYHARGWITKLTAEYQTASPKDTIFAYDKVGQLDRITSPTGAFLDYDYDAAHRLIRVTDNLGNKIEYTLNLMSKRLAEKAFDPSGVLKRQTTAVYNTLSQLEQQIGGTGNTTRFTYDAKGNRKRTIDPRDPAPATPTIFSENLYDALNRVRQTKDNLGGNTTTTYDVLDNPKTVTDPRGLVTSYTYNAFGEMTQQVSPDSGTTNYQYDTAGNRISQTDARNITVTYAYDALNRQTFINFPTDTDTTLTYDETTGGPGAKGRLTTMVDDSGTTKFQYDARGNVIRKDVTTGGITYTLQYSYNGADQLTSVIYPSGMVVSYTRDAAGSLSGVGATTNVTTNLLTSVQYNPFGSIRLGTYGNAMVETRTYDLAGRLGTITTPGKQNQTLSYDAADNLTSLADPLRAVHAGTFTYDHLNRLKTQTSTASNRTYTYDATGNRTQLQQTSAPTSTVAFVIAPTNNRVNQRAGVAVNYDAAGNQLSDPEVSATFIYNQAGRIRNALGGGGLKSTRFYNGLGQRVIKDSMPYNYRNTKYFYDEGGKLLGEAVYQAGSLLHYREYVWLEDRPIAQFTNVKTGMLWTSSTIDYLHTNQLGRPLFMTDTAGVEVYRWQPTDAFGVGSHNTDVDGNGQQRDLRLGLPGQYYDGEVDAWYNYFRDYNARWGRYLESDPIGLAGGVNPYVYVDNNPLRYVDPLGLKIWQNGTNSWSDRKQGNDWIPWGGWDGGSGSKKSTSASCPADSPADNDSPFDPNSWNDSGSGDPNNMLTGSGGTPGNNQAQNRQVRDVVRNIGLSPSQRDLLHREISGQNLGYHEILQIAIEIKGGK